MVNMEKGKGKGKEKEGCGLWKGLCFSYSKLENSPSICKRTASHKVLGELKDPIKLRVFSFKELRSATKDFSEERLLGQGRFGNTYKGCIEESDNASIKSRTRLAVAVKKLHRDYIDRPPNHDELLAKCNFLARLNHPNVLRLIGYCIEDNHRCLVYEYMSGGSLQNHLFGRVSIPLPWNIRMKIALGAAKGLAFLHERAEKGIEYEYFKTSNILLDLEYNVKICDFIPTGKKIESINDDSRNYLGPEYISTGRRTLQLGVYGFGAVLLELLTGRRSFDRNRYIHHRDLVRWARSYLSKQGSSFYLADRKLKGNISIKEAEKFAELIHHCLDTSPMARPIMAEVVNVLTELFNRKDISTSSFL